MYAAICTRPNTSQAVGMVSKYNSKPTEAHLTAAKQILRYLKSTLNFALKYQKSENGLLIGYCDADWANDPDDRHFTSGSSTRFHVSFSISDLYFESAASFHSLAQSLSRASFNVFGLVILHTLYAAW